MKNIIIVSIFIGFTSCNSKNSNSGKELISQNVQDAKSITGIVKAIEFGKDGYTAKIETADKQVYFVTISHSNLKIPKQYVDCKIGDEIKVTGELWKMGDENQITVQSIN